jgi:hypothetical protein
MAELGKGTKISYQYPTYWADFDDALKVELPDEVVSEIDTTHLGITGYNKTNMPGLVDNGSFTFDYPFDPETSEDLRGLLRVVCPWRITSPNGTTYTCDTAYLVKPGKVSFEPDTQSVITGITVRLSGGLTIDTTP